MSFLISGLGAQRQIRNWVDLGEEPNLWFDPRFGFTPIGAQRFGYLWPQGGIFTGATPGGETVLSGVWFDDDVRWSGQTSFPYQIQGYTLDSNGNPLGNVSLKLYRTIDDSVVQQTVSNAAGFYNFGVTDTSTAYYIVAYRSSPDIEGTTVNTLTGS